MYVNLTQAEHHQLRCILEGDPDRPGTRKGKLCRFLIGCSLRNGGDFDQEKAIRGEITEIRVLTPVENIQITVTVEKHGQEI